MNRKFLERLQALTTSGTTDTPEVRHAMKILGFMGNLKRYKASLERVTPRFQGRYEIPQRIRNCDKTKRIVTELFARRTAGHYGWYDRVKYLGI